MGTKLESTKKCLIKKEEIRERYKQYYQNNKLTINERHRQYHSTHKATINERHRKNNLTNKEARKQKDKTYRIENKEYIKERLKRYHLQNKEAIKEKQREYYLSHQGSIRERSERYRRERKFCIKEQMRRYYLEHLEEIKEKQRGYRARDRALKGSVVHWRRPRKNVLSVNPNFFQQVLGQAVAVLHVSHPGDWYRLSRMQMQQVGGGLLYASFGNISKALEGFLPETDWDPSKFSHRGKKSTQRWLRVMLQQLLPSKTTILEDYLHPELLWDAPNHKMELDLWVPEYSLALEYQGEQHYYEFCFHRSLALRVRKDERKKRRCLERGITLATVPYWWDRKKESLAATLHMLRPDVFEKPSLYLPMAQE